MADVKQFKLPDVGEGLTEADIVSWKVKPGDQVTVNQVIVEIETAKSLVELPSPFEGVVTELLVPGGSLWTLGRRSSRSTCRGKRLLRSLGRAMLSRLLRLSRMTARLASPGFTALRRRRLSGRPCWSGTG